MILFVLMKVGNDKGEMNLVKTDHQTLDDVRYKRPIQLRVRYPVQEPRAKITKLLNNDEHICSWISRITLMRSVHF
jgi:hypothetical protein